MKKPNLIRIILLAGSRLPQFDIRNGKALKRILLLTALALAVLVGPRLAHGQTAVEVWVQRYNGPTDSDDRATSAAVDPSGNVIVAGRSDAGIARDDWLIIKYSGAGVPLWTNRYNGPANSVDSANAVAVDTDGNVIVTGFSIASEYFASGLTYSDFDYATIKYSGAGVPLWTNLYGLGSEDLASAVAVDASGNVFVTGSSLGDYATIKYSGAGVALWTNRYNAPGNGDDSANALAVDGSGNVFVTGSSCAQDGFNRVCDYATIAYSGAGVPLWTNRYNGPGNGDDIANAVAVDGSGDVFVTGYSLVSVYDDGYDYYYDYDYATIKYSGAGVALWTNRYNGPANGVDVASAMAVDTSGNVFVTGYSDGGIGHYDYATIKYSGAGVPLWTNRYLGVAGAYDGAPTLAVDGSGNVFVTGHSSGAGSYYDYATIKYSGAGVALWTNRYHGPANGQDRASAVAVDGSGNAFVTGTSADINGYSPDYATIKYSSAGVVLWTNRYNGPANSTDRASAVVADGSGNVFVTGSSVGDYVTIAYSAAGVSLWTNRYNGTGNGGDSASAMVVDGSGNLFVTGYSIGANNDYDYATIKYSGVGVPLWTNRYIGPGSDGYGDDYATAVAVDGSANVFVTGYSFGSTSYDYATIKYSSAGVPLWTNRYNGPGDNVDGPTDVAIDMAVDNIGNVFITGYSMGTNSHYEYATIKYSGAGVPLWTNRYHGLGYGSDYANALAVDGSGNVFVTGASDGGEFDADDYATIKYSGAGVALWTNRYSGPGNGTDFASAVAVDGSGNVFVTGYSYDTNGYSDYATIKYSGAGVALWTNRYNGPGNRTDSATAVAVDGSGNVFVTGYSYGTNGYSDCVTIAYSAAGVPLWTNRYNGPANGNDSPAPKQSLALGPDGSVYVTGSSDGDFGIHTAFDFVTIKYAVPMPLLTIAGITTNTVAISWPVTALNFQLQESTDLALADSWSPVAQSAVTNGAQISVTVPTSADRKFFRLKSQ